MQYSERLQTTVCVCKQSRFFFVIRVLENSCHAHIVFHVCCRLLATIRCFENIMSSNISMTSKDEKEIRTQQEIWTVSFIPSAGRTCFLKLKDNVENLMYRCNERCINKVSVSFDDAQKMENYSSDPIQAFTDDVTDGCSPLSKMLTTKTLLQKWHCTSERTKVSGWLKNFSLQ